MKKNRWTVYFYLNGNNELEPEIFQSLKKLKEASVTMNINVVIQTGRLDRELVNIIKGDKILDNPENNAWSGVRRYLLNKDGFKLLQECGNINLAAPQSLTSFLKWGAKHFTAKNNVLVIGGHGIKYIGAMIDFSQDKPYIMGLKDMCDAIGNVRELKLNLLILDICYMNYLELLYELSSQENLNGYMLTYIGKGPLQGMSYPKMVEIIEKNYLDNNAEHIIRKIVYELNHNLVALSLDFNLLEEIKQAFNIEGERLLKIKAAKGISYSDKKKSYKKLMNKMTSLIFSYKYASNHNLKLINFVDFNPVDMLYGKYYFKLSFSKYNSWIDFITDEQKIRITGIEEDQPIIITSEALLKILASVRPDLGMKEIKEIYRQLCSYKNWILV